MRNRGDWKASKYVYRRGRLIASRDPAEVAVASRLSADLVAEHYDRQLRLHARGLLLDLGCGKAPLFGVYRDHVDEVVCTDWANSAHDSRYLDLICDLSRPLPFADGRFDTIILSSVLEHVPDPALLWGEMSRVLAPGGKVIMNSPFYYVIHEAPHDYYRYTEFALRRFIRDSNMELISIEATGGSPDVMADVFSKTVVRLAVVGPVLAIACQWLAALSRSTPWGRRVVASTSSRFPLSYFLVARSLPRNQAPDLLA